MRPARLIPPPGDGPRIFLSVGDHSGDLDGALLIAELRKKIPGIRIEGLGGDKMIAAGLHCHHNMLDLGIMFILEVLLRLPTLGKIYDQLYEYFETSPPDLIVFIDYPGFNLFLAKKARACRIATHYYIVPQLWAWAPWRIHRVRKRIDRMSVLFAFEKTWYETRGMPKVDIAGHPLDDHLKDFKPNQRVVSHIEKFSQDKWIVGLMPGSRTGEIRRNFPIMIQTARQLKERYSNLVFIVPCAKKKLYDRIIRQLREEQFDALVLPEFSHEVTIELLFFAIPTVVFYKIGWLAFKLLKLTRLLRCKWITLVNILAQDEVYPEKLASSIPISWMLDRTGELLQDGEPRTRCIRQLTLLREQQIQITRGKGNASALAAEQILDHLEKKISKPND
jgi:lipid-A-disaccharide synthase